MTTIAMEAAPRTNASKAQKSNTNMEAGKKAFMIPELSEFAANKMYVWSYIGLIVSAVVAVLSSLLAIIGTACLFWADKAREKFSDKRTEASEHEIVRLNHETAVLQNDVAKANESAAQANRETALVKERAAGLEKDAALAKLELARIDPNNLPVTSLHADIFLTVQGSFDDKLMDANFKHVGAGIQLIGKTGPIGALGCSDFKAVAMSVYGFVPPVTADEPNSRQFKMSFDWPINNSYSALVRNPPVLNMVDGSQKQLKLRSVNPLDNDRILVKDLNENLTSIRISIVGLKGRGLIFEGSCLLRINSFITRDFTFPKEIDASPISCPIKPQ
ncbi:MAG: hypothetical protein ABJF10_22190 [Chthoniobacter sp.]|uniref:hypothetical protein n=1 Tax=Chthoniobacter sp. TaxID=2510640 RepID=UPI0032A7BCF0